MTTRPSASTTVTHVCDQARKARAEATTGSSSASVRTRREPTGGRREVAGLVTHAPGLQSVGDGDRPQRRGGLVERLLIFGFGLGVGDESGAGLHPRDAVGEVAVRMAIARSRSPAKPKYPTTPP